MTNTQRAALQFLSSAEFGLVSTLTADARDNGGPVWIAFGTYKSLAAKGLVKTVSINHEYEGRVYTTIALVSK